MEGVNWFPPGKTTFKKPSLVRANFSSLLVCFIFSISMLVARLLVSFIYGVKTIPSLASLLAFTSSKSTKKKTLGHIVKSVQSKQ